MWPVPAEFNQVLTSGGVLKAYVDVLSNGVTILPWQQLESATVSASRTAASRRQCTVTFTDIAGIAPTSPSSALAPNGNEVRIWFGVTYPNGGWDVVPLGTFAISKVEVYDVGTDVTVTVSGYDRSWTIKQRVFEFPYTVAAGQPVDQAIMAMLNTGWKPPGSNVEGLTYNIVPTTSTTPSPPGTLKPGKDPWTNALLLAASVGYELYFDRMGTVIGRPVPDPTKQNPVMTLTDLAPSGMKGAKRTFSREGIFSAFETVGTGSTTSTTTTKYGVRTTAKSVPIYAVAADLNPASPTYALGPFGVVTQVTRDTSVTSQEQGNAMSAGLLAKQQGAMETVSIDAVPNPALEIDDVVQVTASRVYADGLYVIDTIDFTVAYDASMTLGGRPVS